MKIGGQEVKGPCVETLVLTRETEPLVIKAQAIPDFDEFDAICPEPKAPGKRTKNGFEPNFQDENYRVILEHHNKQRLAYLIIRSLEISNIEWDTTDINNPKTWLNYKEDFKKAGFSTVEINRIEQIVMQANALDEVKLEKAREAFLLGQRQAQEDSSGQATEQVNT